MKITINKLEAVQSNVYSDEELLYKTNEGYNVSFSFRIKENWFDSEIYLEIDESTTINEIKSIIEKN